MSEIEELKAENERLRAQINAGLDFEHQSSCGHTWTMRHTACPQCFAEAKQRIAELEKEKETGECDGEDICGLCGMPGADKYPHPDHWPGERVPDSEFVHAECEKAETARAHAALTDEQRERCLRNIWKG